MMKLLERFRRNDLDEMQERKMLGIEHNGFWLLYWGLLIALLVQAVLFDYDIRTLAGEFILLMAASAYVLLAELRAGLWSRNLKPRLRTNVLCSLTGAAAVAVFQVVLQVRMGSPLWAIALFAAISAACTFALTLVLLQISMHAYRKRRKELDASDDSDEYGEK